jgi:putative membrane protein
LLIGYVHALRHQLRDSDPLPDVGRYVPADVLARLAERRNLAVALLQEAGELLRESWAMGCIDTLHLPVFEASLTEITSIQGGCERIKNTPIPYTYVVLSHRVVAFFCFFLPLGLVQTVGIFTPLVVFLVAHAFFGLDVIGEQIESPFDREPHDLPLDALARTIEIDLLQMLGEKAVPPPVLPEDRVLL